jgi:hypothetical protein
MAANLLAHSHIFACAVARSGAYNRTLTPFGFQKEERTLWQAPEVYSKMSPYMAADKIKQPILLVHGGALSLKGLKCEAGFEGSAEAYSDSFSTCLQFLTPVQNKY